MDLDQMLELFLISENCRGYNKLQVVTEPVSNPVASEKATNFSPTCVVTPTSAHSNAGYRGDTDSFSDETTTTSNASSNRSSQASAVASSSSTSRNSQCARQTSGVFMETPLNRQKNYDPERGQYSKSRECSSKPWVKCVLVILVCLLLLIVALLVALIVTLNLAQVAPLLTDSQHPSMVSVNVCRWILRCEFNIVASARENC